jgi:putative hemolysin
MPESCGRTASPFRLDGLLKTPLPGVCNRWLEMMIEKATGLNKLDLLYRALPPSSSHIEFLRRVPDLFNIRYRVHQPLSGVLPEKGAAVLVANHPFGGLAGVMLAHQMTTTST